MSGMFDQLAWEIQTYGLDVVTAFGEYCNLHERLAQHFPHLQKQVGRRSRLVSIIMAMKS